MSIDAQLLDKENTAHPSGNGRHRRSETIGDHQALAAVIYGAIGLFLFGLLLGPLALIQARKAEKLGVPAPLGKTLGYIDILLGIIVVVVCAFLFLGTATPGASGGN